MARAGSLGTRSTTGGILCSCPSLAQQCPLGCQCVVFTWDCHWSARMMRDDNFEQPASLDAGSSFCLHSKRSWPDPSHHQSHTLAPGPHRGFHLGTSQLQRRTSNPTILYPNCNFQPATRPRVAPSPMNSFYSAMSVVFALLFLVLSFRFLHKDKYGAASTTLLVAAAAFLCGEPWFQSGVTNPVPNQSQSLDFCLRLTFCAAHSARWAAHSPRVAGLDIFLARALFHCFAPDNPEEFPPPAVLLNSKTPFAG
jgi:hypothetical protein